MIKFYCDKCKKQIEQADYKIIFEWSVNNTKLDPLHKNGNLCRGCACALGSLIDNFLEKE